MTEKPTCPISIPGATVLTALLVVIFASEARAVTISTVPVGDLGNAADTTGFGAVGYNYRIGTTEVTNAQYAEFLNATAASDPLELYNTGMAVSFGGITRSGSNGSFSYATIGGRSDMPVNLVSWYDAIRFANWLHNGQGSGDTETGAYTLLGGTPIPSNGLSITRNTGATWFLTSEDEWYKAAYYNPSDGSYFDYPTASNTAPIAEAPTGGSNSANYNAVVGDLTSGGAYTGSDSPYGTFDQGGNVLEWNEEMAFISSTRVLRGGSFPSGSLDMMALFRGGTNPKFPNYNAGFRVATVPEPSTAVLAIVACGVVCVLRKRSKFVGHARRS